MLVTATESDLAAGDTSVGLGPNTETSSKYDNSVSTLDKSHSGRGPGDPFAHFRPVHPTIFVDAPRFHAGIGPGEMPAIIRRDESVLTPGQMRALGGRLGGGNTTVVINGVIPADTKATATTSRDAAGNMRVDVWLDDTGAALLASGQSAMNSELERRYGLTPRL